jgi:O-antigen/teichoic acid export membrane protein
LNKPTTYLKAGSYYLFGNLFNKGIAFLTIPLFTRILSTYDYGIINTYASWVAIVTMVLGMTLHMGIRSAFNDYKNDINSFMSSITFLSLISAISISTVVVVATVIAPVNVNLALVTMCLIQGFFAAIIQNYSMYLMMNLSYRWRTLLLFLPNLLINLLAIFAILFVFETKDYLGQIIPSVIITAVFGLSIIVLIFRKSFVLIKTEYWKYALYISVPIILHGLSLTVLSQSDRIMITSLVGASETGVYSLVYNFSMISTVFIVSLEGIWVPWFTDKLNNRQINQINEKGKVYIALMLFVTLAIILVSPEIMKFMAPKEYWYGVTIIPPIVLSSFVIFIYTLFVNIEHYHKKTKIIALNTLVAAIVNIVLNFIFIPKYGMFGAAYTTLISYIISLVLHRNFAKKIEKELFPIKMIVLPLVISIVFVSIFYLFLQFFIIRWSLLMILCLVIALKKNIILDFMKK